VISTALHLPDEVAKSGFTWLTRSLDDRGMFSTLDHVLVRGLCATGIARLRMRPT
jgi:hypothetical protein